jgi:hypothetical protein
MERDLSVARGQVYSQGCSQCRLPKKNCKIRRGLFTTDRKNVARSCTCTDKVCFKMSVGTLPKKPAWRDATILLGGTEVATGMVVFLPPDTRTLPTGIFVPEGSSVYALDLGGKLVAVKIGKFIIWTSDFQPCPKGSFIWPGDGGIHAGAYCHFHFKRDAALLAKILGENPARS